MEKRYQDPQKRASRWQELESKIFVENFQKKSYLVSLQRWNPNQRLPIFAEVNFVSKFPGEKKSADSRKTDPSDGHKISISTEKASC